MFNFLIYRKLKTEKWNKLSAKKRLRVFSKIEKVTAKKQKRKPFIIVPKNFLDTTLGVCSYTKSEISLREEYFLKPNLQFLALATLFHEQRHIYQREVICSKKKIFKLSKKYRWQQEMRSYINYDGSDKYSYYSMQEIERDANRNAIVRMEKLSFLFRKDVNFINALEEKEVEYSLVKKDAKKELGKFYKLKLFIKRKFGD